MRPATPIPLLLSILLLASACKGEGTAAEQTSAAPQKPEKVGYDLRMLRPLDDRPIVEVFDELRAEATKEGKRSAVLFTADWCNRCERLMMELGNQHDPERIGDVRIFILKEEDWEGATRLDEFNALRTRWYPTIGIYPLFVLLDEVGGLQEEMKDAIVRLEGEGVDPTVDNWLAHSRRSGT